MTTKVLHQLNIIITILLCMGCSKSHAQHNIIPEPVEFINHNSELSLDNGLRIDAPYRNEGLQKLVLVFKTHLDRHGLYISNQDTIVPILKVQLHYKAIPEIGNEGYLLSVKPDTILLEANANSGIFNGFQTLKQLIKLTPETAAIPTCSIKDFPRFKWRGVMLDVSRHFFTVDEVKAYIAQMAEYKFNVFHWHLTDDNGWRIEIKTLPELTEIGAWRVERYGRFGAGRAKPKQGEATPYGGYYTQEQIKEIVQFAAERNITIVPEIDVPGHSMALLTAYPELSTGATQKYVSPGDKFAEWYPDGSFEMFTENTLDPSNPKVYKILEQIFSEVADLFPGDYIHVGGDECFQGFWKQSEQVKAFMQKKDIANTEELQHYFVNRVEQIVKNQGKKMIGWEEVLNADLHTNTAIMS